MRTETGTLIQALKILSEDIQSPDGVANTAILEGAHRLDELSKELEAVKTENDSLSLYIEYRTYCKDVAKCQPLTAEQYKEMLFNNKEV